VRELKPEPTLIDGAKFFDDRGSLSFVNDFHFAKVKRFYQVENHSPEIIRAFHGHLLEEKYVLVTAGAAIVCAVEMTSTKKPSKKSKVFRFVLSDQKPQILRIPAGYANGFRILNHSGKIMFFSTTTLVEAKTDDYRFAYDYWGTEIWETENR
jgi:dTDP-4-dehydrorhamnose 3,5-epimerase